jgi:hypothetical protein
MIFALIIISVFSGTTIYHFYDIYHNRKISRGEILFSADSSNKWWFIIDAFGSIFAGFITLCLILVLTGLILRGYKATVMEWLMALSAIIFFGVLSFDTFPTKGKRKLYFTDKGIVHSNMFYSWHEIEWYRWQGSSDGTTFSLNIHLKGWFIKKRIPRDYYTFDINTKQYIDKILEGRVKIET